MKISDILYKKFRPHRRFSQAGANNENAEKISIKRFYEIFSYNPDDEIEKALNLEKNINRSKNDDSEIVEEHLYIPEDAYVKHIQETSNYYGYYGEEKEKNIHIAKIPKEYSMSADSEYAIQCRVKYIIIIRNFIINISSSPREFKFDAAENTGHLDPIFERKGGILFVFENNSFSTSSPDTHNYPLSWYLTPRRYLIFNNNKFECIEMKIAMHEESFTNFADNYIDNTSTEFSPGGISLSGKGVTASLSDNCFNAPLNITNTFYDEKHRGKGIITLNGNNLLKLNIVAHECRFSGENIIDKLRIKNMGYLYWGGHQKIDPWGENAHEHKKMFMELIERAVQNNDKILEVRLRRELMKCERVLFQKEKKWHSLQDRIILLWSSFVSDYGISWLRPFLGLAVINALLAVIFCFFEHKFSWSAWSILFAEFFNPLSHLATTLATVKIFSMEEISNIENIGWISSVNILQKAVLALCLYEMIKIFRRFSK